MPNTWDVVCVGGGVNGLLTAYELAQRSLRVAVFDRGPMGVEASWAGAGILPPASAISARTPYDRYRGFAFERFPSLSQELEHATGIDVGFRVTGGLELAMNVEQASALQRASDHWREDGIQFERLDAAALRRFEPNLHGPLHGYYIPKMCQVRNPRLLRALETACANRGVWLRPGCEVVGFEGDQSSACGVRLADGSVGRAGDVVVTAGAWAGRVLESVGYHVPVFPVQGQMLALQTDGDAVRHIVLAGKRYLTPRPDGLVLVGSTEEDVGFNKQVTSEGIEGLRQFACELYPCLETAREERHWAGLRPGSTLGSPIMGRAPGWDNLWCAAGHFRKGLQLAPATARLLADWITGIESFAAPEDFSLEADRTAYRTGFVS